MLCASRFPWEGCPGARHRANPILPGWLRLLLLLQPEEHQKGFVPWV